MRQTIGISWLSRRDIEDYLKYSSTNLPLCYPLEHDATLTQATIPLGEEFKNSALRVDMLYGTNGMTHRELRKYMEYYLKELKPHELKALTERNAFRGGFGNFTGSYSRSRHHLHQAIVEGSSS